jgi:hypothetical protein
MQAVDLAEPDLFEDQPGLRLAFPVHATTGTVASAAGYFEFEPGAGSCVDDRRRGDQWLARPMFDPVRWVNAEAEVQRCARDEPAGTGRCPHLIAKPFHAGETERTERKAGPTRK